LFIYLFDLIACNILIAVEHLSILFLNFGKKTKQNYLLSICLIYKHLFIYLFIYQSQMQS